MATTLTGPKVGVSIQASLGGGAAPATVSSVVAHTVSPTLGVGTAAGSVDLAYSKALTVTSGTPLVLDLDALTDPLGGTVNFAVVNAILVSNDSATTGQDLTVGGGTNPLLANESDPVQSKGGAMLLLAPNPGFTVGGSSHNLQIVVAAGTAVPFKITILGRSA